MSLLQLTRIEVGQVGVQPGSVKMVSTASFAAVTAPGYLNGVGTQLPTLDLSPSDLIECLYDFNVSTGAGNYALLKPVINNGLITLVPNSVAALKFAAQYTTVGGAAAEAITIPGALATDLAFVQMVSQGSNTVTALKAVMTANTLTVTFSGNPGNNAVINYGIYRPAV